MASWLKERRGKGFANQICTCSSCRLRFVCCLSGSAHLPAKTYLQIGSDLQQVLLSPQGQVSATRPHPTPSTKEGGWLMSLLPPPTPLPRALQHPSDVTVLLPDPRLPTAWHPGPGLGSLLAQGPQSSHSSEMKQ